MKINDALAQSIAQMPLRYSVYVDGGLLFKTDDYERALTEAQTEKDKGRSVVVKDAYQVEMDL